MKFKLIPFFSILILLSFQVKALPDNLTLAEQNFKNGFYKEALVLYGTVADQNLAVQEKTALCYYFINDYANAEKAFAKIADQKTDVETLRFYAEVLLNNGKYKEATAMFKKYKEAGGKADITHREKIPTWAPEQLKQRPDYKVQVLNIETGGRSLGVTLYKDGLIFATPQEQNAMPAGRQVNDRTVFYDLAFAAKKDSVTFDAPKVLTEKDLNSLFYEGSPSVGGEWLYFTCLLYTSPSPRD